MKLPIGPLQRRIQKLASDLNDENGIPTDKTLDCKQTLKGLNG